MGGQSLHHSVLLQEVAELLMAGLVPTAAARLRVIASDAGSRPSSFFTDLRTMMDDLEVEQVEKLIRQLEEHMARIDGRDEYERRLEVRKMQRTLGERLRWER